MTTYTLSQIRLLVDRFDECFRFYRDAFGFEVTWGGEGDAYASFNTGAITLALFKRELMAAAVGRGDAPATTEEQDRFALIFAVDDVDQAYKRLLEHGVESIAAPKDQPVWGIRVAHVSDPDGNLVEINCPLPT